VTPVPRLAVLGPHLGGGGGHVISPGEVMVEVLSRAGHEVVHASAQPGWVRRGVDTALTVVRWGRTVEVAFVGVYSGRAFAMAELSCALADAFRVPVVLVLHGGNLDAFAARHPQRVRRLLGSARAVVAPSAFLARELSRFRDDIRVIPNALPLESYPVRTREEARSRVLWMRTFDAEYRPELAVRTLAALRVTNPGARLTLAGQDGPAVAPTRRLVADLGLADAIDVRGFLGPDAKRRAFEDHDVFLSTNLVDNAPVSVLEAARCGLVIVATANGGVTDLLTDGVNALVVADTGVARATAAALAAASARALARPQLARRLSLGAQELARRSDRELVLGQWERVIAATRRSRRRDA
jgi:glycosyltransferase involved in cell wall biosynthesis